MLTFGQDGLVQHSLCAYHCIALHQRVQLPLAGELLQHVLRVFLSVCDCVCALSFYLRHRNTHKCEALKSYTPTHRAQQIKVGLQALGVTRIFGHLCFMMCV